MDEVLKLLGLPEIDYDKMKPEERATLNQWITDLEQTRLTPDKIKEHILTMLRTVEMEFVKTPESERTWLFFTRPNRQHVYLKARMEVYLLLLSMFDGPEKAKKHIELSLRRVVK